MAPDDALVVLRRMTRRMPMRGHFMRCCEGFDDGSAQIMAVTGVSGEFMRKSGGSAGGEKQIEAGERKRDDRAEAAIMSARHDGSRVPDFVNCPAFSRKIPGAPL